MRRALAALAALAVLTAGCLGGEGGGGESVTILGAITGDQEAFLNEEGFTQFTEDTGIEVTYEGSPDFETQVTTRITGGDAPDIVLFPQPGLMEDFAEQDQLVDLSDIVPAENLDAAVPGIRDVVTVQDQLVGVPFRLSLKSMVWHPTPEFGEAGYTIPASWDEMMTLTEQIASEGGVAPWCIGVESQAATGWVITDWIEEIMLRTVGPEGYDRWVANELAFDSPEVQEAAQMFADLLFPEEHTVSGRQGMLSIPFGDAMNPMFDEDPACFMHRQANFIADFFPEDATIGEDVNFFPVPDIDPAYSNVVLGAGDIASVATDNPAAEELIAYLSQPEAGEAWAQQGDFLSPYTTFDASLYPNDVIRQAGDLIAQANAFRFDGSDLMPGAVGTGSFWSEMVDWVSGGVDLETALTNIQQSWPDQGS